MSNKESSKTQPLSPTQYFTQQEVAWILAVPQTRIQQMRSSTVPGESLPFTKMPGTKRPTFKMQPRALYNHLKSQTNGEWITFDEWLTDITPTLKEKHAQFKQQQQASKKRKNLKQAS